MQTPTKAQATVAQENGIDYFMNRPLDPREIARVYDDSGINRPTKDLDRIAKMYENSNLVLSAWKDGKLVGVSRALTDFSYCCYLSDLAVTKIEQKSGIGKKLIALTKDQIGPRSMLLLLSAPEAMEYYPKVGFESIKSAFMIRREE